MIVRLNDDSGKTEHEFLVPENHDRELGSSGEVVFRGRSYRYSGMSGGKLSFCPSGPTFLLKEEWVRD